MIICLLQLFCHCTSVTTCVVLCTLRALLDSDAATTGWGQLNRHVVDLQQTLVPTHSPLPASSLPYSSLLKARALLSSPHVPPINHNLLSLFPPHWTILTFALSPKPHPSCQAQLIITRASSSVDCAKGRRRGRGTREKRGAVTTNSPVITATVLDGGGEVGEYVKGVYEVLDSAAKYVGVQDKRVWWAARHRLDRQLQAILSSFEESTMPQQDTFLPTGNGPVLMILGRQLHQLPWENLPGLQDIPITRTPSLLFAAAHKIMVRHTANS